MPAIVPFLFEGKTVCIEVIEGEPRIEDICLAALLGYQRPRAIRQLIERNLDKLATYGTRHRRGGIDWLNERQSIRICLWAGTENASKVQEMLMDAFIARHGHSSTKPITANLKATITYENKELRRMSNEIFKEAARLTKIEVIQLVQSETPKIYKRHRNQLLKDAGIVENDDKTLSLYDTPQWLIDRMKKQKLH